jgi:hypothetical protein
MITVYVLTGSAHDPLGAGKQSQYSQSKSQNATAPKTML